MFSLRTASVTVVLIASIGACQPRHIQDGDGSPSPPSSAEETVPGGFSLPPARDLGSPNPPATVQPIAPP